MNYQQFQELRSAIYFTKVGSRDHEHQAEKVLSETYIFIILKVKPETNIYFLCQFLIILVGVPAGFVAFEKWKRSP